MEALKFIAGSYIVLFCLFMLAGLVFKIKVGTAYRYAVVLLAFAAAVFAFCFEPGTGLDLYRLQRYAQSLNFNNSSFWANIWGTEGILGGMSLTGMISFNLLCYVVRLIGDMRWLSTISVFFTTAVLLSIIVDYAIDKGYSSRAIGLGAVLAFMGLPLQYVFSGVRNAMAVAAVVLASYLLFYKKRSVVLPAFLFFFGATMHPAVLILAVPILLCRAKGQILIRAIGLFSVPLIFLLPNVLRSIPLSFFQYLGARIAFYRNTAYPYDRPEMIANLLIFAAVGISVWIKRQKGSLVVREGLETHYLNAYYILGFIMVGCSVHRDFALRIGYLMGIMALPLVCKVYVSDQPEKRKVGFVTIFLTAVILACVGKVYYDTIIAFSRWIFI